MITNNEEIIKNLVSWKGGWAAKSLFDDAVSRFINRKSQNQSLASTVAQNVSGLGAKSILSNYYKFIKETDVAFDVSLKVDSQTHSILDLSKVATYYPIGSLSNYWLEQLCEHLDTSRKNINEKLNILFESDDFPTHNADKLLTIFSFPIIQKYLNLPQKQIAVEYCESDKASLCWRRWHLKQNSKPVLFETTNKTSLKTCQWFVWRLIHDATHLVHLAHYPQAGNPLNPEWLITMEAVSMFMEKKFLNMLNETFDFPHSDYLNVDLFKVKAVLLLGLVERSLRLDYDLAVHGHGEDIETWIEKTKRKTGIHLNIYNFTQEFHGLPGFSAAYMIGLDSFEATNDKVGVLSGTTPLKFFAHKEIDKLSRSPLTDIPAKKPEHEIYLNQVGTTSAFSRVTIKNPFTNQFEVVNLDINLFVSLNSKQRGIHMSRLQQAAIALQQEKWDDIPQISSFLTHEAKRLQVSQEAYTTIDTTIVKPTFTPRSQTDSCQPITITSSSNLTPDGEVLSIGIAVKVMTACPCTLAYSRLKTVEGLKPYLDTDMLFVKENLPPTFTHSQPGIVKATVFSRNKPISIQTLYECIKEEAHIIESVLKRPDEHSLVEKVYRKPQFCEDLSRSIATSIASILSSDDLLEVEVELDESIHPHKVLAKIKSEASKLWN